jgi:hypothetical protein
VVAGKSSKDGDHGKHYQFVPSSRSSVTSDELKNLAARLAKRCRQIIQSCLREEEWQDADEEFFDVILEGLRQVKGEDHASD